MGSPHLVFDEFDIPIISYIEFPSYANHGRDFKYPPTEGQRLTDKKQNNIVARFEGRVPEKIAQQEPAGYDFPSGKKTLGFAARDLSSAKGLESFIATAAHLIKENAHS